MQNSHVLVFNLVVIFFIVLGLRLVLLDHIVVCAILIVKGNVARLLVGDIFNRG